MTLHPRPGALARVCAVLGCLVLTACSSADDNLQHFIAQTERQPGSYVKPLPAVPKYQAYTYADQAKRSPFVPSEGPGMNAVRPSTSRPRQYLEQFPLDTLSMVGTLHIGATLYGLVETKDGIVHRVTIGNYMGQNDGRVVQITPAQIRLVEVVPDGLGGYMKRPAALGLSH